MKKLLISTICISILAFACSKPEIAPENSVNDELSPISIESAFYQRDNDSRIQMFNLLSSQERYQLWIDHLNKAKNQFLNSDDDEKVILIEQLISYLSYNVFSDSVTDEKDIFLNYYMPLWVQNSRNVFDDFELYDLTFDPSVDTIGEERIAMPPDEGGGVPECFCHVGNSGYSCKKWSFGIPSGITIEYGICERTEADCSGSNMGCGFLWLSSCYGNHCNF